MISQYTKVLVPRARVACLSAALFAAFALPARAEFLGSVQIGFQTGNQTGTFELPVHSFDDHYDWALAAPLRVYSDANPNMLLATINQLTLELEGDPGVSLGFNVTANAGPTHITLISSVVSFATLVNPLGVATAAITVTDADSTAGANATGLLPGSMAYQAIYNGSSVFANLVVPVTAALDHSATGSDQYPAVGTVTIPGSVSSIQSQFDFMLTANDTASGTSRFNVFDSGQVPEPSSIALAAIGAAVVLWRARRRFI